MIKALMIEDDEELAELIRERLLFSSIELTIALSPLVGLELLKNAKFDILVLDLSLPQIDGLEICKIVRLELDIPIIISSARSDMLDKSLGFSRGADDFLPKPYDPDELGFRIKALLRRCGNIKIDEKGVFVVNEGSREISKNGDILNLTSAEYDISAYFIKKAGIVVSREELLMSVGSIKYESGLKSIDVMIGRIRQKIGDDPKNPRFIIPVRGVGYKFSNK